MILWKEWSPLKKLMFLASSAWHTVTGAIATFIATVKTPVRLSFTLKPVQSGSGDPSPDNVRSISGHDSVTLKHSGEDTSDYDSHTATFPSTVYGGVVDWSKEKVISKYALISKKYSELNNGSGTTPEGYSIKSFDISSAMGDYANASDSICNMAKYNASSNAQNVFRITSSGKYIYTTLPTSTSADTEITVCYPLATPFELSVSDADSIVPVIGENNIWVEGSDNVVVSYR